MAKADLILQMKALKGNTDKVFSDLIKNLEDTENQLKETGKAGNKTVAKIRGAFKRADKAILGFAKKWGALMGTAGFVGVMYKGVKAANEFQKSMAEVSTLLGKDAPAQMKKFDKAIKDLASRSSSAANELSKGLYQVISAGTKGTEDAAGAMKLLEAAQKASVAGVSDVFSAVDLLTTSLNAYQQGADQATHFSDILFKSVKLGKLTFNDLAAGMGTVASAAAGAGVTFQEVNAAMAAMTAGGVPSARAFTSLNAIMRVAAKGSKELDAAFGEAASDILKRDGLVGVLEKLNEVTQGDTIALQKLGIEQEAITGLSVLASSGIDKFRSSLEEMQVATGATEVAYQKMAATFDEQTKMFWNKLNVLLIEIGEQVMPHVLDALQDFGDYVKNNQKEIVGGFMAIAKAAGFVLKAIAFAVEGFGKLYQLAKESSHLGSEVIARVVTTMEGEAYKQSKTGVFFQTWKKAMAESTAEGIGTGLAMVTGPVEGEPAKKGKPGTKTGTKTGTKRTKDYERELRKRQALFMDSLDMMGSAVDEFYKRQAEAADKVAKESAVSMMSGISQWFTEFEKKWDEVFESIKRKMPDMFKFQTTGRTASLLKALGAKVGGAELETEEEKRRYAEFEVKPGEEDKGFLSKVATGFMEKAGAMLFNWAGTLVSALADGKEAVQGLVDGAVEFWESLADNLDDALIYLAEEGIPKIIDSFITNLPKIISAIIKNIPLIVHAIAKSVYQALSEVLSFGIGGTGGGMIGGTLTGAGLGAAIGSVIPGVGTALGAGIGAVGGFIASLFHGGGFVEQMGGMSKGFADFSNALRAHTGMFVQPRLGANEVPTILEAGEGVIRKEVMSALGGRAGIDAINRGQGIGGNTIINNLRIDHMMSEDTEKVVDGMQSNSIRKGTGRMNQIIQGGNVTGLEYAR